MSPANERRLALFAIVLFFLLLTCMPTYLYVFFFFVITCGVFYYKSEKLFERLGLNPRRGLTVASWPGKTSTGLPAVCRSKNTLYKSDVRNSLASLSDRSFASSIYRRDATFSDSAFSPRSILMGSYLSKAESTPGTGRPTGNPGGNPREQLRERLLGPNHGVPTPNKRLSFGDPVGAAGKFTITPQRHYPLQHIGTSPVGVFPPAQWDSFCKKNILTQRNTPMHSPVTVKIAKPNNAAHLPFFDQLHPAEAVASVEVEAQANPCSRETVLSVLRASRKRPDDDDDDDDVGGDDDDESGHEDKQKCKRRRNDSSGSSQSVFEPLLANGVISQLVPKPGSLKRGINVSVLDEYAVKRSRTCSFSSVSGCPVSCGTPGSDRNPIRSSYSSSRGYRQKRIGSNLSPSLVNTGQSQSQTIERAAKKPREEDAPSPISGSAFHCNTVTTTALSCGQRTPMPDCPVMSQTDSGGNSGKHKRKIQLVSMYRGEKITLPPPPELGYTITVKDLDMEKKATLSQIQKDLEDPAAVPPPASTVVSTASPAQTTTVLTLNSTSNVSAAPIQPLLSTSTTSITVGTSVANPLLESLKSMKSSSLSSVPSIATSAAPATSMANQTPSSITSTTISFGTVKSEPSIATPKPTAHFAPSPGPSAFAKILAQPLPSSSTTPNTGGGTSFGFMASVPTTSAPTAPSTSSQPASHIDNPAPSVFKPIFGPAMTQASVEEVTPTQTTFKPIFGNAFNHGASLVSSVPATLSSTSLFGGVSSAQPMPSSVSSSVPVTQSPSQSLFGSQTNSFSVATSVSTASAPAPFGGLNNSHTMPVTVSSSSNTKNSTAPLFAETPNSKSVTASVLSSASNTSNPASSLFCGLTSSQPMAASISPSSSAQSPSLFASWNTKGSIQFKGLSSTVTSSGMSASTTTTNSTKATLQFGNLKPAQTAPPTAPQNTFTFGQSPATTSFTGFGMANNTTAITSHTPATQATFGSSVFSSSASFANSQAPAPTPGKPFTFGASVGEVAAVSAFGTPASTAEPTFGNSTGFAFGNTNALPVSAASVSAPAFTFGAAPATPQNSATSGGFNFTAAISGAQFGTPTPAGQKEGFSFGAGNTDHKPAFGASTPAFGAASGPIPFGSPGTPIGGFNSAFGTPSATFSIGSGSKPGSTRQRLQARRQHTRKK